MGRPFSIAISALLLTAPVSAQTPRPIVTPSQLSLIEAVKLGRAQAIGAELARINVQVAEARQGQRRGDLLPSVAGNAHVAHQTLNFDEFGFPGVTGITDPFDVWSFQVQATQSIYNASLWARNHAASDSVKAAGLDARTAGEEGAVNAGIAYVRVLGSAEAVTARLADSAIAADLLDQSRQLVLTGVSPPIDSTRSSVNFAAVRTQLVIARNLKDRSRLALARALDLPPAAPLELTDSLAPSAEAVLSDPDSAVAFAMAHRTEVMAEQQRLEAVERSLKSIKYENLPSIGAVGQYTQSGNTLDRLSGTYAVGVQVSVPIFDGLKRQTRASEQSAKMEAQSFGCTTPSGRSRRRRARHCWTCRPPDNRSGWPRTGCASPRWSWTRPVSASRPASPAALRPATHR